MKHKFLIALLALIAALCMAFGFAGCDETEQSGDLGGEQGSGSQSGSGEQGGGSQKPDEGEQGVEPHVHTYGEWKVTKEATCKEEGAKERECACGEKETVTFRVGHDFEDMTCRWCGTKASLGLEYTLINDGKEYEVSGIGECKDTELIITNNYQGKPVTSIGYEAFYYCSGLTSVTIPDSVTSIGAAAFANCYNLTSIDIPASVTSIGAVAFRACSELTSIDIPDSVTSIKDYAFYRCSGLSGILEISDSVTSIGRSAFYDCSGLTSIKIGSGVNSIGDEAFEGCSGLTSVVIPDSVTSIGYQAFEGCSGLTSVTIGSGVTTIGDGAFYGCRKLERVTIGRGVTSIGYRAFFLCNLKEVHFENPNGWKVSRDADMTNAETVSELDDPAQAAKYLTETSLGYYWKRYE